MAATGPAIISMRQVAQRAGVSVGTVSYHFSDKEDLLEECLDPFYEELDALWQSTVKRLASDDPRHEVATDFLEHLFDMLRCHRNLLRVRLTLAMGRGYVPHRRLEQHLFRYVKEAQPLLGLEGRALGIRFNALYVMLVRHCTMSKEEWFSLTGTQDVEQAAVILRGALVDAGLGILDMRPPA